MNRWTNEQLEAITTKGCNILVAAAAGAGKTAVLVERIIQKITGSNPVDIDKLLIVTFTSAAASEMRERIGNAISRELEKNPESKNLQRQMALINRASITTMHSFCLEVIKNNYQCIDLDPGFRIADETEATLMKLETLEELFEDRYEDDNLSPEFLQLVECYGGSRDDKHLQDMVLHLHGFVQSHPWPEKWLKDNAEAFNIPEGTDFGSTAWGHILIGSVKAELKGAMEAMRKAAGIAQNSPGLEPYVATINEELSGIEALLKECGGYGGAQSSGEFCCWDKIYDAFSLLEFGRLSRCGKDADKAKQEQVKASRDSAKKTVKKLKEEIFALPSASIAEDLRSLCPMIKCLAQLVTEFGQRYAAKKKDKNLLDFNDLEHFCLRILIEQDDEVRPSKVAAALRERFEEILIDEYQDSNLVQEVILNAISRCSTGTPNIFMVGDVKQSIYRFRQARPELFMGKYNSYSNEAGAKSRKILLYKNFRSRNEVVNAVNFIFKQIMSLNVGELDYNDTEALNAGAEYAPLDEQRVLAGGAAELHIVDVGNQEEDVFEDGESLKNADDEENASIGSEQEEQLDSIQTEARVAAGRIKELVGSGVYKVFDKNTKLYRPMMYRDIVMLLRTTRNWSDVFMEELSSQGIPAYADTGTGYFKTDEVQTIMSLLQVIDNPMQDIPLLSVLRSPIELFSPEELIDIRLCNRETSFFEALRKMAKEGEGSLADKSKRFIDRLDGWRKEAFHMSTDELIWYLYTDTGYYSYVGAMPGGVQRQANLRVLFERARQFEKTSYKGLFNFIGFINKLKRSSGDMGSAKILGENENVVRIMSIHKSKGLEFPVVIVSGCGKSFNMQDINKEILLHQDLGFGPDFVDYRRRVSYPTTPKQALRYKTRLETLSEEMRILYVAFTRAREKLILTGTVRNLKKSASKWSACSQTSNGKLPEYEMSKAKCYMDWIGPAVMRHEDGTLLREAAQCKEGFTIADNSCWEIKLWNKNDVIHDRTAKMQEERDYIKIIKEKMKSPEHGDYYEEISKRLDWKYPYEVSSMLPAKISVTELKRRFNSETIDEYPRSAAYMPQLVKKPSFLQEAKGLTAPEKGTILHCIMQHINLDRVKKALLRQDAGRSVREEIDIQIDEMIKNELITAHQAEVVDRVRIERFFRSPIGLRLLNSGNVRREVAFNIEIKGADIYKEKYEALQDEPILVQGVIDCYFYEKDGIVLLDYKTDYVPEGGVDTIKERYRMQIDYYAMALERITRQRVKERYIYLFWNGEVVHL